MSYFKPGFTSFPPRHQIHCGDQYKTLHPKNIWFDKYGKNRKMGFNISDAKHFSKLGFPDSTHN